jgi:hypothetical protein
LYVRYAQGGGVDAVGRARREALWLEAAGLFVEGARARATAWRSSADHLDRSVPFGKYCRSSPLVFSFVGRCQGEWCSPSSYARSNSPVLHRPVELAEYTTQPKTAAKRSAGSRSTITADATAGPDCSHRSATRSGTAITIVRVLMVVLRFRAWLHEARCLFPGVTPEGVNPAIAMSAWSDA